jgi:hypothetical protein
MPSPGPTPYQVQSPQPPAETVPADFPDPHAEKKVCKVVASDDGDKRVCMWQRRH